MIYTDSQEKIAEVIRDVTSTPEKAMAFLQEVGIYDAFGNMTPEYSKEKW